MSAQGEKTKQQEEKVVLERNVSEQLLQPHSLCCHRTKPFKSGKAEIKCRVSIVQIHTMEDLLSLQRCSKSWHNIVLLALGEVLQTLDPSAGKSWVLFLAPRLWSLTIFSSINKIIIQTASSIVYLFQTKSYSILIGNANLTYSWSIPFCSRGVFFISNSVSMNAWGRKQEVWTFIRSLGRR